MKTKKDIVKMLLNANLEEQDIQELLDLLIEQPLSIDVDKLEDSKKTRGDRLADKISSIAGSWSFILIFISFLIAWIILNSVILIGDNQIDPYPFILLNLVLSCIAALQAPIIMMSQNRQAAKDSLRNHNDYKTDLKSELLLEALHFEMNTIMKNQRKILKLLKEEEKEENDLF